MRKLTDWPDSLPKWDTLSADQKKLFARQAEVFAAYAAYTDHEIGRVIQQVEDMGKLDNTLIIYIVGDNGTSPEGTLSGTPNQYTSYNGILDFPIAEQLKFYDAWGSDADATRTWRSRGRGRSTRRSSGPSRSRRTSAARARAWRSRGRTASRTRAASAPSSTTSSTSCRRSSKPTGIKAPQMVDGIKQKPIEGVSMAYTFDKANANAPSTRKTQYFEMIANRGIYHDGWYADTTPPHGPWILNAPLPAPKDYKWELYNLTEDYSQANDLAAKMPDKLKQMQALFDQEAAKYHVLPLNNDTFARALAPRPSATAGQDGVHLHRRECRASRWPTRRTSSAGRTR